jgi:hypothetical protein
MPDERLETSFRHTETLITEIDQHLDHEALASLQGLTRQAASQIHAAHRFSRIHTSDSELRETLLTRQLAHLARASQNLRTLTTQVNRKDPSLGRRLGDSLETTTNSLEAVRWQVREHFSRFIHRQLEQHQQQTGSAGIHVRFRQPAQSGGESALPVNQYDPADPALSPGQTISEPIHPVTTVITDRTIEAPAPVETVSVDDPSRSRKWDNGFAIW